MTTLSDTESNVARYVLRAIGDEGVGHVFLVPGFMVEPFLPEFAAAGVTPIVACHEGDAAYMADGYARATRNFGVAMDIGGPGVTNMVTAISAAFSDGSPVLIVAGNVPFAWEGKGTFQDSSPTGVEDRDVLLPMTVFAAVIPDPALVGSFVRKAMKAMKGVEHRPAFLSVPQGMQTERLAYDYQPIMAGEPPRILDAQAARRVPELPASSTRISILAGNGAVWSKATADIQAFADESTIPVVSTLRAKGVLPEDARTSMGVFGVGGSMWANHVVMGNVKSSLPGSEILIVLGATLNENNTHGWSPGFAPSKAIVRVDINPNNVIGKEYEQLFVPGDVRTFIEWLSAIRSTYHDRLKSTATARKAWLDEIRHLPYYDTDADRTSNAVPMNPARVIAELRNVAPRDAVLIVDSGAHTFFGGHHWTSYNANEFLLLSTTGPIRRRDGDRGKDGTAFAATLCHCRGRQFAHARHGTPHRVRYQVPIVIIVINNSALGNVYVRAVHEGPTAVQLAETPTRDWAAFARSIGGDGIVVDTPADLRPAYEQAFATSDRPFVVDARCDPNCPTPNTRNGS